MTSKLPIATTHVHAKDITDAATHVHANRVCNLKVVYLGFFGPFLCCKMVNQDMLVQPTSHMCCVRGDFWRDDDTKRMCYYMIVSLQDLFGNG